jgi:hypothetical protein
MDTSVLRQVGDIHCLLYDPQKPPAERKAYSTMAHILTIPATILFTLGFMAIIDHQPEEILWSRILIMFLGAMLWVVAFRLQWPSPGVGAGYIVRGGRGLCLGVQVVLVIMMFMVEVLALWEPIVIIGLLGLIIWAIYRSWWTWFIPK